MSNARNIIVSVPFHCDRTEKEYSVKLPLEEAAAFAVTQDEKTAAAAAVQKGITDMAVKPDLVVYYKGQCIVFGNVHEKSENGIMRAVNEIANAKIFELPEPKPRKKAENTEAPAASAEIEAE